MSIEPPPNIHPSQRLTTPTGQQAEIDAELVPVVRALWALNLTTTASCQDIGEYAAASRDPRCADRTGHAGFIDHHREQTTELSAALDALHR